MKFTNFFSRLLTNSKYPVMAAAALGTGHYYMNHLNGPQNMAEMEKVRPSLNFTNGNKKNEGKTGNPQFDDQAKEKFVLISGTSNPELSQGIAE